MVPKKKMKLNKNTWQTLNRENEYFRFIESCKSKQYNANAILHVHHIIPKYVLNKTPEGKAYLNTQENLIILSDEDHLKAHEFLYKVYGNEADKGACLLLKGSMNESRTIWRSLGTRATNAITKANGATVFNSEWQKEMATRSMARPDALEIRSKGGKVGGVKRNLDRVIKKEDRYLFKYNGNDVLCILNCRTGGEVLDQLNFYQQTPLQRVTPLLKGDRKSLNGWSCSKVN